MTTPASSPTRSGQAPPDRVTQTTLLLLSALTIMSGATIAPALPAMQAHFADTPNAALLVKLALTILGIVIAITAPLFGVLADRYGRRPVLLASLALYVVGGGSGLIAQSLGAVLLGRVVLGLAVAGTMTAAGALVNDLFSGAARGRFLSQQAAFNSFGGAVLLPLGGVLAAVGWRGDPSLDDGAFDAIHEAAGGVPRRINTLCSRVLLLGFLEELHALDARHVEIGRAHV